MTRISKPFVLSAGLVAGSLASPWAGALAAPALAAQAPSGDAAADQARALLEDGLEYWNEGKYKQALDNFNTIVNGFSGTEYIDDALLYLGRHEADVVGDVSAAREKFEAVAQRFPQNDQAPGAYYWLGMLTMQQATTKAELDDAMAQFDRVGRLYAASPWVPTAMYGAGRALRKGADLEGALERQRRVAMEYPTSEAAPMAQYEIGHLLALMGQPLQAMGEFQKVRNAYPESVWAKKALERTTALYRFLGGRAKYRHDASFSLSGGDVLKDVRAIQRDPAGNLWVASDKAKSVVPFDAAGKIGPSFGGRDFGDMALTSDGTLVIVAKTAVRVGRDLVKTFQIPGEKPQPLEKMLAAVVLPSGEFLVSDEKQKAVVRFDATGQHVGPFGGSEAKEVTRMSLDPEGAIVLLDQRAEAVVVYDATGRKLRTLAFRGAGYDLRGPVDVAVDESLNTYVVDKKSAVVYVFDSGGAALGSIGAGILKQPEALTLEPSGAVLVYDDGARQVLRFH
jgi:TolA-binding protein